MIDEENPATAWGRTLVAELAAGGLEAVCIAPGSRSTPLTLAFARHPSVEVFSHLDERSAAFFALGRARRTGEPTAVVTTSGTATANLHPAVVEADHGRVPMVVLTADRPPELRDSGANQTIDQRNLYGDAVRYETELPVPSTDDRARRSVQTTAARLLVESTGTPAGPVHCNCPFRKPLEPTGSEWLTGTDVTPGSNGSDRLPSVSTSPGVVHPNESDIEAIARALSTADRPLIVAGPADPRRSSGRSVEEYATALSALAADVGAPVLADPLSACRFGPHVDDAPIVGGYDSYVDLLSGPDVVLRVGDAPTSARVQSSLAASGARQFLVDPAGQWREATFTATDLVVAEPVETVRAVRDSLTAEATTTQWVESFERAETCHWEAVGRARRAASDGNETRPLEGAILASVFEAAPDPATIFLSNSMPIRDADRFARPRGDALTTVGNRGASGIDGITSTALGAGSATEDELVVVTGDLAFYHDSNGLLAIDRCGVDATIVVIHNDGGGIFHMLPIEAHDPPFTEQFKTPHGLSFEPLAELHGLEYRSVTAAGFDEAYREALDTPGSTLLSVTIDAARSHRNREALDDRIRTAVENTVQ